MPPSLATLSWTASLLLLGTCPLGSGAASRSALPLLSSRGSWTGKHPLPPSLELAQHQALGRESLSRLRGGGSDISDPGWLSVLPAVVALGASVALKQVIVALILGVWTGAMVLYRGKPTLAMLRVFDRYLVRALADPEHAGVLLFTLLLGGTIGIVQRAGGGLGLARLLASYMTTASSVLSSAFALCCMIFFDDYSTVLIVGSSLKPILKPMQLAPERLGLIIHTLGVVLASIAPISSWIGLQLGYVAGCLKQVGSDADPFLVTMGTIPYRFFPLLMFALIPALLVTKRDLGPMAKYAIAPAPAPTTTTPASSEESLGGDAEGDAVGNAGSAESLEAHAAPEKEEEEGAMGDGPLAPKGGVPHRAINAVLPFGVVAVGTFGGMLLDGAVKIQAASAVEGAAKPLTLVAMLSESDSIAALIWASTAGWLTSMGLVLGQKVLDLDEAMDAWLEGMKDVLAPILVLLLAWALGDVVGEAKAADFLSRSLHSSLPKWSLPALISIVSGLLSFACGSSFGTMGIILPLVAPLAKQIGGDDPNFLTHCIASVLGASTFGNLCSPISDTTILTVLATKCDLHKHIASITPYTLLAAGLSLGLGSLPVGFGLYGPATALLISTAALVGVLMFFGTEPPEVALEGYEA